MSAGVPDCVVHAHNYLLHITEKYCKANCPRFNRLSVVGWCTSGRKKVSAARKGSQLMP
ncbi:hypothetical protein PISMIDRAFT_681713, partial [Pisolithus microcarpus 441]